MQSPLLDLHGGRKDESGNSSEDLIFKTVGFGGSTLIILSPAAVAGQQHVNQGVCVPLKLYLPNRL